MGYWGREVVTLFEMGCIKTAATWWIIIELFFSDDGTGLKR